MFGLSFLCHWELQFLLWLSRYSGSFFFLFQYGQFPYNCYQCFVKKKWSKLIQMLLAFVVEPTHMAKMLHNQKSKVRIKFTFLKKAGAAKSKISRLNRHHLCTWRNSTSGNDMRFHQPKTKFRQFFAGKFLLLIHHHIDNTSSFLVSSSYPKLV